MLTGGVYAVLAVGLTLIHGATGILNLAHGSLLVVAMVGAWALATGFEIDPYASLPLLTLILFVVGWAIYRCLIGPASRRAGPLGGTAATLVVALVLEGLVRVAWRGPAHEIDVGYVLALVPFGPFLLPLPKVVGFVASCGVGLGLWLFMTQTDTGRSIRAVAQDEDGARLVGLRPEGLRALACGVGSGCLGAAACLLLPGLPVTPDAGPEFLLVAVAGAVVGRLGNLGGAILGGVLVGVLQALADAGLDAWQARLAVPVLLALVLVWRVRPRLA